MLNSILLATICNQWKMYHDTKHKVELKPLITLQPKYGMHMKLEFSTTTVISYLLLLTFKTQGLANTRFLCYGSL